MIGEYYLIHDPINGGYWDNHSFSFRVAIIINNLKNIVKIIEKVEENEYD